MTFAEEWIVKRVLFVHHARVRPVTVAFGSIILGLILYTVPIAAQATAFPILTYTYEHHIFTLNPNRYPQWKHPQARWYYRGRSALPPDGDPRWDTKNEKLPDGWSFEAETGWDDAAIASTIDQEIGKKFERPAGNVTIRRQSGAVVFDGNGLTGRSIRLSQAAALTRGALENDITNIVLPVTITQPTIIVQDADLQQAGIRQVVTIGESDFLGSPKNRQHNIAIGVKKFNGHLIPQGSIFSFDDVLGPVNASTGYLKELVIQGKKTVPDYGGGLCQVSSTAYRGPWEYGLPIIQRRNHSYAVSYYGPQGTDATIYPPSVDMKFKNDTPGALLIQSFIVGTKVYFIYYGVHDERTSEVFGPFIWGRQKAPTEELIVKTTEILPGKREKISDRHDGMKVLWYRSVTEPGKPAKLEPVFSQYETRQMAYQIGISPEEMRTATGADLSPPPSN